MSNNNTAIVEAVYATVAARDLEALREYITPGSTFVEPDDLPYGGIYRGFDGFLEMCRKFADVWADPQIVVRKLISEGAQVVALVATSGIVNGTRLAVNVAEVWTLAERKVVSVEIYYFDTRRVADALAKAA